MSKYPIIRTKQNDYDLIVFSIPANDLIELCYFNPRELDRETGLQRPFKKERSKEIASYLDSENSVLANNIIINFELKKLGLSSNEVIKDNFLILEKIIKKANELNNKKENIAFVIDGQHRLRAFEYANNKEFPLIVTAFFDLSLAEIAEIFVKINYYQKPVNKSLVYDLLGITPDIFPEYYSLHNVVKKLNEDYNSPFNGMIKMLGLGKGIISQASLISAIEKYKIIQTFSGIGIDLKDETKIYDILWVYFSAIKKKFNDLWGKPDNFLSKSISIRALIMLLKDILLKYSNNEIEFTQHNIFKTLNDVKENFWSKNEVTIYGGEKGVKEIYSILLDKLKWNIK